MKWLLRVSRGFEVLPGNGATSWVGLAFRDWSALGLLANLGDVFSLGFVSENVEEREAEGGFLKPGSSLFLDKPSCEADAGMEGSAPWV